MDQIALAVREDDHPIPERHRDLLRREGKLGAVTAHLFRTGGHCYRPADFDGEYRRMYARAKTLESELMDLNGDVNRLLDDHRHERDGGKAAAILDRIMPLRRRQLEMDRDIAHAHWDAERRRQALLGAKVAPDCTVEPS